jgi:hypothetical protein
LHRISSALTVKRRQRQSYAIGFHCLLFVLQIHDQPNLPGF